MSSVENTSNAAEPKTAAQKALETRKKVEYHLMQPKEPFTLTEELRCEFQQPHYKAVINCLRRNPQLSISELSQMTDNSLARVRGVLIRLKDLKLLEHVGGRSSGYWCFTKTW